MKLTESILSYTIPSVLAAIIGWALGRKKNAADIQSIELQNVKRAIEIWRSAADELSKKCDRLSTEMREMRKNNYELQTQMSSLKNENIELRKTIKSLEEKLNRSPKK